MGCPFTIIEGRCYSIIANRKEGDVYYDFFSDAKDVRAKGWGVIDLEDRYQAPGASASEVLKLGPILWGEQKSEYLARSAGKYISFAHLLGETTEILHGRNFSASLDRRSGHSTRIPAEKTYLVAIALANYDATRIMLPPVIHEDSPKITDKDSAMETIVHLLKEIVLEKEKPLPRLESISKVEISDPQYERENRDHAILLLQFYWLRGSARAGAILADAGLPTFPLFNSRDENQPALPSSTVTGNHTKMAQIEEQ